MNLAKARPNTTAGSLIALIVCALLVVAAASTGARFEPGRWYAEIAKPAWTPPNSVFPPVWTLLYIGIALAGWLAWRAIRNPFHPALLLWVAQLVLNTTWSWLFFSLHRPDLALIDIFVLLAAIVAFGLTVYGRSRAAAWLFVPYGLWVGYATALNYAIWQYNS